MIYFKYSSVKKLRWFYPNNSGVACNSHILSKFFFLRCFPNSHFELLELFELYVNKFTTTAASTSNQRSCHLIYLLLLLLVRVVWSYNVHKERRYLLEKEQQFLLAFDGVFMHPHERDLDGGWWLWALRFILLNPSCRQSLFTTTHFEHAKLLQCRLNRDSCCKVCGRVSQNLSCLRNSWKFTKTKSAFIMQLYTI